MKKIYLTIAFLMVSLMSFATGETVVVVTNVGSGIASNPTQLGPVNPCSQLLFRVNPNLPDGYVIVSKYEWFVNGVSTYVNTTDPGNSNFLYTVISNPVTVYCKVTYQKQDGTNTSPSASSTFSPQIKQLNFDPSIVAITPPPNYGCTSTVSYSLNQFTCTGNFCSLVYPVSSYNITWQAPVGWVQTSLTNNGSNVSFTPDANSTGSLIATIHIPTCSYTETRTFGITRTAQQPSFTTSTVESCNGSSSNISISPTCGAINYTYSIVGNSGVKFSSNNLQTLTTSSTTVNVTTSGGASVNSLKAIANYPNSISSTEAVSTLNVSSAKPSISASYTDYRGNHPIMYWTGLSSSYNTVCNSYTTEIVVSTSGASSTQWSKVTSNPSDITWYPNLTGNGNLDFYFWAVGQTAVFKIDAVNGCGTTSNSFGFKSIDCSGGTGGCLSYSISPNPSNGTIHITPNIPAPCGPTPSLSTSDISKTSSVTASTQKSITQVDIYDNFGNLKKSQVENNVKQATLNLTGFKTGVYVVIISDGTYKERQQIIIQ